jgi:uncharacterized membrane protein
LFERETVKLRGKKESGVSRLMEQQNRQSYRDMQSSRGNHNIERLANGLGWFSIGLGVAEIAAPGSVARLIGVDDDSKTRKLLRFYGVRELTAGIGILSQTRPAGWLWGRVAGDFVDLASLGSAMNSASFSKARTTAATAAVVGVTALDVYCGQQMSRTSERSQEGKVQHVRSILVNKSPQEVYDFWRDLQNFSGFMDQIESVRVTGDRRTHWTARLPGGRTVEWDSETVENPPDMISWHSLPGSDVQNSGTVRFKRAPGGRGTLVTLDLAYAPPGGILATGLAKLFRSEPGQMAEQALRAAKQVLETGEVIKSDSSIFPGMHAARPAAAQELEMAHQ